MEPIYGRTGKVVAWMKDGFIFDRTINPCAFIRNDFVYGYEKGHLGQFKNGFFRDKSGHAVAFIKGAHGGPGLPMTQLSPLPPIPPLPPLPPIPPLAPMAPIGSLRWSDRQWSDFVGA